MALSLPSFVQIIDKASQQYRPFELHTLILLYDVSRSFLEQLNPDELVPLHQAINSHIAPFLIADLGDTNGRDWLNRFSNLLNDYIPPIIQD